ncbi:aminotransferase class V-fold PLP-dependent enzyme [Paracoccus sp. PARArs4]|uniref:aminotransferase class V-fold PLP-dependent enzyme n=1 Tax=Paracoccus sp. PARArs4 TaxID=2853442 RepID=UPI0024A6519F|nr:aminotransferase class V-fold PLP-dependent enzyme [Paracoccus sp. PARArs4]
MDIFDRLHAIAGPADRLHEQVIGHDLTIEGPFGPKRMIYADHVASGRALMPIEQLVMTEILPRYANSHTEASHCGAAMTAMRRAARAQILRCTGGTADHAAIFCGSGATAGINRLVQLLGAGPGSRVIIGPYEHHSNILPWRESGAEVIELPEGAAGGPDRVALAQALDTGMRCIVSMSAASNVTGVIAGVAGITRMVKAAGAAMVWDYAGGAPYLPIDMGLGMDAVVTSPHKFLGGPGASGVMILRRDAVRIARPSLPGGGTVRFVNAASHDYAANVEAREEGGTPNVLGDIRAGLVFALKDRVGQRFIDNRNARWLEKARDLDAVPGLAMLGRRDVPRLPILAFRVAGAHQQFVTRLLSDLRGIQARGGCACAGPYVHRLLGIDDAQSERLRQAILSGAEIEKPGFTRLNLCWAAPEPEIDAILDALRQLPQDALRHRDAYRPDPATAIFRPAA